MHVIGWIKRVSSALNAFRAGYCAGTEMEMAAMISQILLPTLVYIAAERSTAILFKYF